MYILEGKSATLRGISNTQTHTTVHHDLFMSTAIRILHDDHHDNEKV
jgi:hypothetical protein